MTLRKLCLLLIISLLGFSFFLARSLNAKEAPPRPWPGKELRILDKTSYMSGAREAIKSINRTGIPLKLRLVKSRPHITLREVDSSELAQDCDPKHCAGRASSIGYRGKTEDILLSRSQLQKVPGRNLIMHELGHILGLSHNQADCSVMNPQRTLDDCSSPKPTWFRCGFSQAEAKELFKLYPPSGRYSPWCSMSSRPQTSPPSLIDANGQESPL